MITCHTILHSTDLDLGLSAASGTGRKVTNVLRVNVWSFAETLTAQSTACSLEFQQWESDV